MHHHRMFTVLFTVCVLALAPFALAQPDRRPPSPPAENRAEPRTEAGPGQLTTERLRSMIERRLERVRAQEERMNKAIEMLENGASVEDLRAEYRDLFFDRDGGQSRTEDDTANPDLGDDKRDRTERRRQRLTDEERGRVMSFLAEEFPEIHARAIEVMVGGGSGPDELDPRVERRMRPLIEMMQLKERDPEMFAIRKELWTTDRRAWEAARTVRDASGDNREQAIADLHEVLSRQFDLQLRAHQLELDRLEARLAKARAEAQQQATDREQLIKERLLEIIARQDNRPSRGSDRRVGRRDDDRAPKP